MTARRPLTHVRRPAAAALALLALFLPAGLVLGFAAAPAGAQAPPQVELAEQTTWVHPGERFRPAPPGDGRTRRRGRAARRPRVPAPRRGLRATLDGDLGDVVSPGSRQPLASLPAGPGGTVTAGFVAGRGVDLGGRGTYPVEVQLLGPGARPSTASSPT